MTCVKTGCHIYIIPYGTFAYGDAHEVGGAMFFRLVKERGTPLAQVIHYEINNYDSWWDKNLMRGDQHNWGASSTLVVKGEDVLSYGYDGRPIIEFEYIMTRLS